MTGDDQFGNFCGPKDFDHLGGHLCGWDYGALPGFELWFAALLALLFYRLFFYLFHCGFFVIILVGLIMMIIQLIMSKAVTN